MARQDQIRFVGPTLTLVLIIGFQLLGAGCQARDNAREHIVTDEHRPALESWDVTYHISHVRSGDEESVPRMRVLAAYMARYEEEDSTYTLLQPEPGDPQGRTTAYLFNDEGDSSATITANRFVYFEEERRLRAEGNVIVETADERRLETEELIWYEQDRSIEAPGFVRIMTPEERVRGYSLTGDENLSTYQIAQVTGQVTLREDS